MDTDDLSSDTAREALLRCPLGIMLLTASGRIAAVNPALEQMLGVSAEALKGRDLDSVPRDDLRRLFCADANLVVTDQQGALRRLTRTRAPAPQTDPDIAEIHYFSDQTELARLAQETETLRHQLDQLSLRDATTGLMNERALMLVLEPEVSRSRRYHNPLCVVMLHAELKAADGPEPPERRVAQALRDQLRWADLVGRNEEGNFVLVLPETGRSAAQALVDKIARCLHAPELSTLHFGIAEWTRSSTAAVMLRRAADALAQARAVGTLAQVAGD